MAVRVLLVDDHALLLEGLRNLLEAHGIEVAAVASNGREAATQAKALRPDVILMDIRMPVCDGLAATRIIKADMPESKIVILTTSTEDQDLFEAVKSGACGYLLKSMDADGLVEALHDLEQDIPPFAPGLAAKLLVEFARAGMSPASECSERSDSPASSTEQAPAHDAAGGARSDKEPLSRRQTEILALVAQGLSYKEVGARIHLSPRTVKYHMAEVMRKLHLENRAQVLTHVGRAASDGEAQAS
jgi:DNA-binding NarL/FixJ family response regulator